MPKQKTHRSLSIRTALSGLLRRSRTQQSDASRTGRYYRSISEMPLKVFVEIICSDDLSHMVIEGEVSHEELAPVWNEILEAYLDVTMSDEDKHLMTLISQQYLLEHNIIKAEAILKYLSYRYDPDMITILERIGASGSGYPKDGSINARKAWEKRVVANIKRWRHRISEIEADIVRLTPKDQKQEKITRSYFDDVLARISQHFKYHIDENIVTVSRFLAMLREYKQHLIMLQKQAKTT